jgi:MFS family permease
MFASQTFRAFRHRDYFIFWIGFFLGHTAMVVQTTATGWLILELTNSAFYLGLEGLFLGLPRVLFSVFGGAIVDRSDRKSLFIVTQSLFLLTALFLAAMDYFQWISVWHILGVSAITGLLLCFDAPVRHTLLNDLVPASDLVNAISLYHLVFNGSALFGPALAGLLIPLIGTVGCFAVHAFGSLIILGTTFMIRIPRGARGDRTQSLWRDVTSGLTLVWNTPLFFALFSALAVASFSSRPYLQFMPIFARDVLEVGAPGLGMLLMAPGAGAVFGALVLATLTRFPRTHRLLLTLAGGFGLFMILFGVSRVMIFSLVVLFIMGAFQTCLLSAIAALLQIHAHESARGRLMSLYGLINRGLGPMGVLPMGIVAAWLGAPLTVVLAAVITLVVMAYLTLARPHLRAAGSIGDNVSLAKESAI